MQIWLYVALALLLQIPVTLTLIALAVIVQRTSQAAFLRALDNREKQLAFLVQSMMDTNMKLNLSVTTMQTRIEEASKSILARITELSAQATLAEKKNLVDQAKMVEMLKPSVPEITS